VANAKKCDRCGRLFEESCIFPELEYNDRFHEVCISERVRNYVLDLCKECVDSFEEWFDEPRRKLAEKEGE
jgi:hypothetical protein